MKSRSSSPRHKCSRRVLFQVVGLGVAGTALAACAGSQTAPTAAPASTEAAQPTKVASPNAPPTKSAATPSASVAGKPTTAAESGKGTISFWGHNNPPTVTMYKKIIQEFEKKYPNITVDYSVKAGNAYAQLVLTALASGSVPDVFRVGDWQIGEYVRDGAVQAIPPTPWGVQNAKALADKFVSGVQQKFLIGDGFYAVPEDVSQLLNIINMDYLKQAGYDSPPPTPDKLVDAAKKMTVIKNGQWVRSGFEYYYEHELWETQEWTHLIHSFGGAIYDKDVHLVMDQGDAAKQAAEYIHNSAYVWKFSNPSFALTFGQPTPSHFQMGKSAMNPAGAWKIPQIEQGGVVKNWQADLWRTGPKDFVLAWAWSLGIAKISKNPSAASQFLSFLHTPEIIDLRESVGGQIPGLKGMDQTTWVKDHPKVQPWLKAQAQAEFQDPYPSYPKVSKILAKAFEAIAITGTIPDDALTSALADLRKITTSG